MISLSQFCFELAMLKRLPRSGSFLAGIKNPDSIAEHVFRATHIAFLLAETEGANGEHAAWLSALHDNAEARIGDLNRVMQKYITNKKAIEYQAFCDQVQNLPEKIRIKYIAGFEEFEAAETLEAKCAKDADYLEMAFQARQHLEEGVGCMQDWLNNVEKVLKTKTAQEMFASLVQIHSYDWWKGLKKS